jgi:FtsP/CotA-like multicopper oxidase with cupredoxin domain
MMGGSMMSASPDGIEWEDENQMMNQMSDAESIQWKIVDQDTGLENMDIDWKFAKGQPVKIRIFNDPNSMHPMQHPMHFHGQRFLVLERNGKKETNLVWKDTVLIPSGETVDILLDTSNPGTWMAHCHIAEHLEAGMMMKFEVK